MSGLILALQFFTRLPINFAVDFSRKNLCIAFFFLPFIGLLFGGCIAIVLSIYDEPMITALIAILVYVILGGSLHMDGLSDCTDGFAANTTKEKTLAIMSDPHIGTFGVIAIVLDLMVRFVMYQLLKKHLLLIIVTSVLSRTFVLYAIRYGKPAKPSGLGVLFYEAISKYCFQIYFVLIFIAIAILCFFNRLPYIFLAVPLINLITVLIFIRYATKRIGGTTGDVNGAIVEILELLNLMLFYFLFK